MEALEFPAGIGRGEAAFLRCIELTGDLVSHAEALALHAAVSRRVHSVERGVDELADAGLLRGSAMTWWVPSQLNLPLLERLPMAWHALLLEITGQVMCEHATEAERYLRGVRRWRASGEPARIVAHARAWIAQQVVERGADGRVLTERLFAKGGWLAAQALASAQSPKRT